MNQICYLVSSTMLMLGATDAFSTENLSIHRKTLIGLKDEFNLHKFL